MDIITTVNSVVSHLRIALFGTLIFFMSAGALAQGVTPTKGKDFWMGFMKNYEIEPGEALNLFIVSDVATSGNVTIPGQGWSQAFTVAPNVTTTVTIPNNIAEVYDSQVVQGRGVRIETQDTVSVFAINFGPFTADGTKILPIPSLGTNYMVASYPGLSPWDSQLLIVATVDDTEVEIIPSAATSTGNAAGVPFTVSLDQGETYQVISAPTGEISGADLTGTIVRGTAASGSCRPFAVFSGTVCTNIPVSCSACDHIYEQNFPIDVWGTEYYVTPFVFELNPAFAVAEPNYTYRVLASVDGTSVTIDGGAPFILNAGEFEEFQYQPDPHCVEASEPVAVIQYMQSISCGGNGDPAMLVLDDVTKKIDNITFSTVESTVITSHYLNVVINVEDIGNVTFDGVTIDPALFSDFPGCPGQLWAGFEITPGSHTLDAPGGGVTGYVYGNGEAESYAYSIGSFSPLPPIVIDNAFCTNEGVTLAIENVYSNPYWYNLSDPDTILEEGYTYVLPEPIQNGIYVGVGSEFVSGCEEEFFFSVEVPSPPVIDLQPGNTSICKYESIQLNVSAEPSSAIYTYAWTPAAGLSDVSIANPIATPLTTTTYTVTVTTPTGCASNTATVTLTVEDGDITRFDANPEEALFCLGDEVELSVVTEEEIWSDDFDPGISLGDWNNIQNGQESTACGSVSGNALYFNGNAVRSATTPPLNCTDGGTVYFSLKVANGVAPCDNAEPGDNVVLEYSLDGVNFSIIQTYFEAAYPDFVAVSQAIPPAAFSTATRFRWRQLGTYAAGQDNWILDNCYIGAVRTEEYDYTWTPAAGLSSVTTPLTSASPVVPTTYFVTLDDFANGCVYVDSVQVDVGQPFTLDMSEDQVLCNIQGVQLSAIPDIGDPEDYTYEWSPQTNIIGAFTATPTVTPNVSTVYSVVVTSAQGCEAEGSVAIAVSALSDLSAIVSDNTICEGDVITLTAQVPGSPPNISYTWSPADDLVNPVAAVTQAAPQATTTYTMTAVDIPTGCSLSDEVTVTVFPAFTVTADPAQITDCNLIGTPVSAISDFGGALIWSWSPPAFVSAANQPSVTLTQDASVDLVVTATNPAGCSVSAEVIVDYFFETTDLGADTVLCEGQSVVLDAGWPNTYTFNWSNGATTSSIEVSETGIFSVDVTSPLGCTSSDEIGVEVFEYPVVDLGEDTELCAGESLNLVAGLPGFEYFWSTGDETPQLTVTTPGVYSVNVFNNICESSDEIEVIFNPLPLRPFSEETANCFIFPPFSIDLDALNAGSTYLWSTGSTEQVLTVRAAGYYQVLITTELDCSASFGIMVEEVCPGTLYIPNSFTPDGDGLNDAWVIYGTNIEYFELSVWNRWGELFFWSDDISQPWVGQHMNGEFYVQPDTYLYQVKVRLRDDDGKVNDQIELTGHVNVVR